MRHKTNMQRRYVAAIFGASLLFSTVSTISAQNQQPPPTPTPASSPQKTEFGRIKPLTVPRVGVNPDQLMYLSLHDAILKALENNNQIQIERTTVLGNEMSLKAATGAYDITVGADLNAQTATRPTTSSFTTGAGTPSFTNRSLTYNFSAQQLLRTGGTWQFQIQNLRQTTDQVFVQRFLGIETRDSAVAFNPSFTSSISFNLRQPLFRNFRIDQTRRQIQISQRALDLSDSAFRQRVIEIITQVQNAYWDLVFAIRNVEIAQESLLLAKTNLENNRKQVQAGTLAPIELAQSEAEVQRRTQELTQAIGNVTVAENTLKNLILGDPNSSEWTANIVPTENIEFLPPAIDLESALKLALANRPELEQLRFRKEQNRIDLKYFANQKLPQIDLVASYSSAGLAGTPTKITTIKVDEEGNPVRDEEGNLVLEQRPRDVPPQFIGGAGKALRTAFSNDFRTYSFGLSFSFPIRNRVAEGQYGAALAQSRSLDFQERQLIQSISVEVRNALQQVEVARQNIEAARAERISRERQLEGEQKKFEAGLSTTFFVLQFQNFLSQARALELQALVNYNKAIANLQRVISTTLDVHNIQVSSRGK
ncbi:MAG TPA: TolC family protein [Blastocatellia bacterium]|nr:TolC family protein [Blastocatellia bacterium]